jgi:hypothetical protein
MHGGRPLASSRLWLEGPWGVDSLILEQDYLLYTMGDKTYTPHAAPLVFAGYGIAAPEYDYNDYQNLDVDGRIVVVLSGEPRSDDPDYFDGPLPTRHSSSFTKQQQALARGARGSILVPIEEERTQRSWNTWQHMFAFEHVTLAYSPNRNLNVLLNPERAASLFHGSDIDWRTILDMERQGTLRSFPLAVRAGFVGGFEERDFVASNIVGAITGNDPLLRDSWVLVSAHYDHLGVGPAVQGDSIYNGLVDNALGCATTLEIARTLSSGNPGPRRSVAFLFTTGEEVGLLGARAYCLRPSVPLSRTIANVNVDGIAIFDTFDDIVGVGAEISTLQTHLENLAADLDLILSPVPERIVDSEAFARSDQLAFAEAGIPSILVMEGSRYRHLAPAEGRARFVRWGQERYHTPFDDLRQPVDRDAVLQHSRVLLALVESLADTFTPPQWLPGSPYVNARLRAVAEGR